MTWEPGKDAAASRLGAYLAWLESERGVSTSGYESAWRWSVENLDDFWLSLWQYMDARSEPTGRVRVGSWPGDLAWFPDATINWAEEVLTVGSASDVAIVAVSQTRPRSTMTRGELRSEVSRVRAALVALGVGPGDRVFAYAPNIPETVVALLATASLGAVWAACPPEFGVQSVVDRAAQVDPVVLIAVDGYRYGGREFSRTDELAAVREHLPQVRATIVIDYLGGQPPVEDALPWLDLPGTPDSEPSYDRVDFSHPLWILFSSGTTGLPKAIVHGHGGIVLEHFKVAALMQDVRPGDTYFSFTTTAWMVWNRIVSTLMTGATVVLVDGDPTYPDAGVLPRLVQDEGVTHWGASGTYLDMCRKAPADPFAGTQLPRLRSVIAAGSACSPEVYAYVDQTIKPGVQFYEGSGGTDVCTGFVSGTPLSAVVNHEIPARMLGVDSQAFDEAGHPVLDQPGELVITQPMPSMPLFFWGDADGVRYREAYFDRFPGVWHHGDRFLLRPSGRCRVLGRSDATLNRGGVRLGTAEFYSVLERLPEIHDSLVIHVPDDGRGRGEQLALFVQLTPSSSLDDELRTRIRQALRDERSPRHVPSSIHEVTAIPYTHSGKKLEVPVKRLFMGEQVDRVASPGSLRDPRALDDFARLATHKGGVHA